MKKKLLVRSKLLSCGLVCSQLAISLAPSSPTSQSAKKQKFWKKICLLSTNFDFKKFQKEVITMNN